MAKQRRSRKKRKTSSSEELFRSNQDEPTRRRRIRSDRVPKKLLIGLVLLGGFLVFLPTIVVNTPLKQVAINRFLSGFRGTVEVESISCGWIANTRLTKVVARDEEGELLFSAAAVRIPKSLTSMIGASDFSTITIVDPVFNLHVFPDGSNLETALAGLLASDESGASPVSVRLAIENASAEVRDVADGAGYSVSNVHGEVNLYQADQPPLQITLRGEVRNAGQTDGGTFETSIAIDADRRELDFTSGEVALSAQALPVDIASPFLTRFVEPLRLGGVMDGDVNMSWSEGGAGAAITMAPASIDGLVLAAPARIGSDQVRLANTWLQGDLAFTPRTLRADRLVCQTSAGSFKAHGEMNWREIAATANAVIPANDFQAEGVLELAPLIAMLPETLPLQQGMQVESGTIRFNAGSRVENADRRLVVNLESSGLTAIRNGQRLNWHKPARVVAAIRQTPDNSMILESLDCATNFLKLEGSATTEAGEFTLSGDLKAALAEVRQIFDLGDLRLEGKVNGNLAWRFEGSPGDRLASRPLSLNGRFHVGQPVVHLPGQTSWSEDELNVLVQAAGQLLPPANNASRVVRLDTGTLELVNAAQSFEARLSQPVSNPSWNSPWNLHCHVAGDVSQWLAQLATFVSLPVQASGMIDATGTLHATPDQIALNQVHYQFDNLRLNGFGLNLDEPQVVGDGSLVYVRNRGLLQVSELTLASSAVSARVQELQLDTASEQGGLSGQVAFRADVNGLQGWLEENPRRPDSIRWFGSAQGTIDLTTSADAVDGTFQVRVSDLIAARQQTATFQNASSSGTWTRLLEEKQVQLSSALTLSRTLDQFAFENLRLDASAMQVNASGSASDLAGTMNLDVRGEWSPDWQRLKPLVDSYTSGMAELDGVQGGDFQIRGPVFNPHFGQPDQPWIHRDLQVQAGASWQGATLLGMPVGGSQVNLNLAEGIAAIDTGTIPLGGGNVRLSPRIDMRGQEMWLFLPPGNVIETVELTPEVCRGWLKYVAPVIAEATAAQGKFSVSTSEVRVPLQRIRAANVRGVATLHGANVGPGPLGQQLVMLVAQVKALARGQALETVTRQTSANWLTMPEQQVPFAVQQGRVFHDGLQFRIDDVVVRTSGSVGLDQSLQMIAEVPIQDEWVGTNRWTQGLKGQTLRIPVTGTVSGPSINNAGLQQMSRQLLQQAATGAINNEVQGLIEKGNQRIEDELKKGLGRLLGGDR